MPTHHYCYSWASLRLTQTQGFKTRKRIIFLTQCKYFIVDECDQVIGNPKMRADIQEVFIKTKHNKQVMMFSATMPDEIKKGTQDQTQIVRSS